MIDVSVLNPRNIINFIIVINRFVERHTSINEEEEKVTDLSPILKLRPHQPAAIPKRTQQTVSAPNIMISQFEPSNDPPRVSSPNDTNDFVDGGNHVSKKPHHSDRPVPQYGEIVVLGLVLC